MTIAKLKKELRQVEAEIAAKKAQVSEDYEVLKEHANVPIILIGGLLGGYILGRVFLPKRKKMHGSASKSTASSLGLSKTALLTGLARYFLK